MRYEIENGAVTFFLYNPKRVEESSRHQSFAATGLTQQQIIPMLDTLVKKLRGKARRTQERVATSFLRPLFSYFENTQSAWPLTSSDWQLTAYRFFQFYLTDTNWSSSQTDIRMMTWSTMICGFLEDMKEDEIIPRSVVIPSISKKKIQSIAKNQPLLGQTNGTMITNSAPPQKLLVDISFGMTDADYLDSVEKKCRHLVSLIRETCLTHWSGLMKDVETGRQLAAQVKNAQIDEAIATGCYHTLHPRMGTPTKYASYSHAEGHNWAIALVRRTLAEGKDIGCVSLKRLRASPFFPKLALTAENQNYTALDILSALPQDRVILFPPYARFYRFCGLLSNLDATVASCLLICEHPEFTSESLQNAELLNVRGKPYLLMTDNGERSIYSLDKPRAGRRKSVVLTELSKKLVSEIIHLTAPIREVLRRAGDKSWRYLFLGVIQRHRAYGFLGVVEGRARLLNGHREATKLCLNRIYPELSANGLNTGSFDYRRLRNTIGIIKWFETGSIVEMSRRLGNTRKVALEYYLPPALLHAWNTRIIRRFQNTLIVLAAHAEPYLLEVTDFSTIADLQHFIAQLIADFPTKTSPLADEIQKRLGSSKQEETTEPASTTGLLNIRLSPKSLGLLYAFSDLALTTLSQDELDQIDVQSGLAPRQFTDMASLLRHAAENKETHPSLREILDVPLLTRIHGQALALKIGFDSQFAELAIKHQWDGHHG